MAENISVPISSVMRDVTVQVTVTGVTLFGFRLWLGAKLIKLGTRVIGEGRCEVDIYR